MTSIPVDQPSSPEGGSYSHVVLVGRIGATIEARTLPSGDQVTAFTVVVDRPAQRTRAGRNSDRRRVDAITCQATTARIARTLERVQPGDRVQVEGVLRRRFWRGPGGLASATDVEVRRLVRCMRA